MSLDFDQLQMARHALGLPNDRMRSYRNHYAAAYGVPERTWNIMVAQGFAERGQSGALTVGFCLTVKGARAAWAYGESLDPEDFPNIHHSALPTTRGKTTHG